MKSTRFTALGFVALFASLGQAEHYKHPHATGDCQISCPRCHCCVPKVEIEKMKQHCWEVKCEPICIPQVKFPWERKPCAAPCGEIYCPPAKCAKTRHVHVLQLVEYECEVCKYTWTPLCQPPCECASPTTAVPQPPTSPPPLDLRPAPPSTLPRQAIKTWKYGP
jgi:hypothetical protein